MHGRMHVVDGVVAVVEGEEVDDRSHKVTRAVIIFHLDAVVAARESGYVVAMPCRVYCQCRVHACAEIHRHGWVDGPGVPAVAVNFLIAAIMLQHIHRHNAPLREKVWQPDEEQELAPI